MEYYDGLVKKAIKSIENVGDLYGIVDPFEVNTEPSYFLPIEDDELPFVMQ